MGEKKVYCRDCEYCSLDKGFIYCDVVDKTLQEKVAECRRYDCRANGFSIALEKNCWRDCEDFKPKRKWWKFWL